MHSLLRLEHALRKLGAPIVDHFAEPLSEREIVNGLEADTDVRAHPTILRWFGWHDGPTKDIVTSLSGSQLCGNWYSMSLATAIDQYRMSVQVARTVEIPEIHPPSWFPIVMYYNGPQLCVNTGDFGDMSLHLVDHHSSTAISDRVPLYESVDQFADLYAEWVEDGAIFLDSDAQMHVHQHLIPTEWRNRFYV